MKHRVDVIPLVSMVDGFVTKCRDCSHSFRWSTREDAEKDAREHEEATTT